MPFAERLKDAFPEVQRVPMVMPLTTAAAAQSIHDRLRISLPAPLSNVLEVGDVPAAWEMFATTLAGLRESPLFAGAAVMTFEMDPRIETAERIAAALG